jgi:hypothetical protein
MAMGVGVVEGGGIDESFVVGFGVTEALLGGDPLRFPGWGVVSLPFEAAPAAAAMLPVFREIKDNEECGPDEGAKAVGSGWVVVATRLDGNGFGPR